MTDRTRRYTVIKSVTGSQWGVWWDDSVFEDGDRHWVDGGYVSTHRTKDAAETRAAELQKENDAKS